MNNAIHAVYADGVFRPLEPVNWPEGTRAEVIPDSQSVPGGTELSPTWPAEYFGQTAGALAGEPFERPPQGESPQREAW